LEEAMKIKDIEYWEWVKGHAFINEILPGIEYIFKKLDNPGKTIDAKKLIHKADRKCKLGLSGCGATNVALIVTLNHEYGDQFGYSWNTGEPVPPDFNIDVDAVRSACSFALSRRKQ
jgi:hypothetical protein